MNPYYKDYGEYLSEEFPGIKVQKLSINAGFSCPNRNGMIGRGGCIYCDNTTFTPGYCFNSGSIVGQLEAGKQFFSRKYPSMKYLAYFQSFTNTFTDGIAETSGNPGGAIAKLDSIYRSALDVKDIVGLVIGSRPDCMPDEVIDLLCRLNRERKIIVELGAETSFDQTLQLVNRGHTWAQTEDAVRRLTDSGLSVGLHFICGLPGETEEMILSTVRRAIRLPIDSLKFHHLQVIKGTALDRMVGRGELDLNTFTLESYLDLCVRIVKTVPRKIAIERFLASSPPEKVIAPKWGIKNYEFTNLLLNRLRSCLS